MMNNRYINNTYSELEEVNQTPIFDYEDSPLLSLQESLEQIIVSNSSICGYVEIAIQNCNRSSNLLTHDESAAIYLYSMPSLVFSKLNIALRGNNRQALEPWFPYLKLFMTALKKLNSYKDTVWRGVNIDDTLSFVDDDVHIWWSFNSCTKAINIVEPFLGSEGTVFAIQSIYGKDITEFSSNSEEKEVILMPGTCVRRRSESLNILDRIFFLHLEEVYSPKIEVNYLIETLKQNYLRNSRIECLMNPAKSFPIDENYIHLSIVTIKEQHKKEQQLKNTSQADTILNSYEEIYGTKTPIEVKDIFNSCKDDKKQVLVFGRAGIGKSTFCRFITYQWAKGLLLSEYDLVALIPLRRLTADRYPNDRTYSLIDLIKKEVFTFELTDKEKQMFDEQFDPNKTLWILDGYDEIIQTVPEHLQFLFDQLLNTHHHIITSRPYMNTLSHQVQMEITGFTDDNITKYVEQFFHQLDDVSVTTEKLLVKFLKSNRSIWGIAHIPVNLELICSLWSNEDWSETNELTITSLYTKITVWLCRRYLNSTQTLFEHEILYEICEKEIRFLESLAFNAMKSNTIIIRPCLLKNHSMKLIFL